MSMFWCSFIVYDAVWQVWSITSYDNLAGIYEIYLLPFQPKYYDGDYKKMLEILIGCKKTGCIFLVGGRNVDGAFKVGLHTKAH